MQAWEHALELRNELYEWWGSDAGRRFSYGWSAARAGASGNMPPIGAIERVKLQIAPPYYVTSEMCDLLEHASGTLPRTVLHPTDPLTDSGFALLSRPIVIPDINNAPQYVSAFAWAMTGHPEDVEMEGPTGLHLTLYAHREHDNIHRTMDQQALEQYGQWQFCTLSLIHESPWRFGTDYSDPENWRGGTIGNEMREINEVEISGAIWMERILHTFFLLSQQKIAAPSDFKASRGVRRRAETVMPDKPVPEVRVVTLRRYKGDLNAEVDPESRGREYSHRWIVGAFWRKQWYPSLGIHKPKYIAEYIKGPKDKPLVIKDTTYVWRR